MKGYYVQPQDVCYPKNHVKAVKVLVDKGQEDFSVASLMWDDKPRIGIRWNGTDNHTGTPQSRGRPTWFILPTEIALAYAHQIGGTKVEQEWKIRLAHGI